MPAKIILIPADESKPVTREPMDTDLETAKAYVGGWIEQLPSPVHTEGWIAIGNEEAKLLDLPYNRRAHLTLVALSGHNPADPICGNVFLAGVDDEGETTDAPEGLWERVMGVPGVR